MNLGGVTRKKKTEGTDVIAGELRRAQLITTYGPGAIADFPDNCSVVMGGIEQWNRDRDSYILEPRLERLLGVDGFIEPACKAGEDGTEKGLAEIPSWRFPRVGFCNKCGRLGPYEKIGRRRGRKYFCLECQDERHEEVLLLPSRFVAACINGHLLDFPYGWWVHRGDNICEDWGGQNLEIEFTGKSGGLDSIVVRCRSCGKERSMEGCFDRDALKAFGCSGDRPWLGPGKNESCRAIPRAMQRGASGVWFAMTASALSLPSASRKRDEAISKKMETLQDLMADGDNDVRTLIRVLFASELKKGLFTVEELLHEIRARQEGKQTTTGKYTLQNLYEDEYTVLSTHDGKMDVEDISLFRAVPVPVPAPLSPYFSRLLLLGRLREVMALYGFRRVTPEKVNPHSQEFPGYDLKDGFVPLGEKRCKRLPAVEMLGEGIFLQLREEALQEWEKLVGDRYGQMAARLHASNVGCENFSPRYVLLHTVAHLLIRQLALECGYSGASIRERIYSTFPENGKPMAGILLYTSSTDADGSLGGLVRNGRPQNLERIFFNMLREASWCSTDPVCAESSGQGFGGLNNAACHACALLPETSCVMRNCLLDRIAVIGAHDKPETGFFHELMVPAMDGVE